jgi:hypothetical protein
VEILDGESKGKVAILNGRFVSGDVDKKGRLRLSSKFLELERVSPRKVTQTGFL